ncbi:hypothetical protein ANANG_G00065170 [Anguilla anguilla]|uniref:Uncharacterized protein n=1 Tax=Anguilla anguilla TaxID=7936 RepID=A0A9D3MRM8_ANGAN|nr:hypothetical protein ANANG_G00065170 [Anguilla anguilla]
MAGGDDQDATVGLGQDVAAESREKLCTAARKLAANLSRQLEWRFEPIFSNSTFLLATLLDPRYKASCFPNSVDVETLKRTLVHRMELCGAVAAPARNTEETPVTSSCSVFSFLQKKKSATPMRTHAPSGELTGGPAADQGFAAVTFQRARRRDLFGFLGMVLHQVRFAKSVAIQVVLLKRSAIPMRLAKSAAT